MRRGMGCAGLICGVFGLAAGIAALFFDYFIYPYLDYESVFNDLGTFLWLFNTLLIGLAVCFISAGLMMKDSYTEAVPHPGTPPPLPKAPPASRLLLPPVAPASAVEEPPAQAEVPDAEPPAEPEEDSEKTTAVTQAEPVTDSEFLPKPSPQEEPSSSSEQPSRNPLS